jgi:hypothetical protein
MRVPVFDCGVFRIGALFTFPSSGAGNLPFPLYTEPDGSKPGRIQEIRTSSGNTGRSSNRSRRSRDGIRLSSGRSVAGLFIFDFHSLPSVFSANASGLHMVRTTRNSAFPLIMRSYPSAAFANGYFSIMGRTPVISANRMVSCESVGMPPAQPLMPFLPKSN